MPPRQHTISNADNIAAWSAVSQAEIEAFGDEGDFARQHLLTPQLFALLGSIAGTRILDAGAGTGYLARKLARAGAIVTAVEPTEPLFRYLTAREALEPLRITCLQQDLSTMTQFEEHFDIVVANMVLLDIPDYEQAMTNCLRALVVGGAFIFSLEHPCLTGNASPQLPVEIRDYFTEWAVQRRFGYNFHRPLERYVDVLAEHGALIERIKEPRLSAAVAQANPEYAWSHHVPAFVVMKAIKMRA